MRLGRRRISYLTAVIASTPGTGLRGFGRGQILSFMRNCNVKKNSVGLAIRSLVCLRAQL